MLPAAKPGNILVNPATENGLFVIFLFGILFLIAYIVFMKGLDKRFKNRFINK